MACVISLETVGHFLRGEKPAARSLVRHPKGVKTLHIAIAVEAQTLFFFARPKEVKYELTLRRHTHGPAAHRATVSNQHHRSSKILSDSLQL